MSARNIGIVGLGGIGSRILSELRFFKDKIQFLYLADGDKYELSNTNRQDCDDILEKNKAEARAEKAEWASVFTIPEFLTKDNIDLLDECSVIFSCVDNHKTRNLLFNWASGLENIDIISGGNDYHDGNINLYSRRDNKDINPNPCTYHPEIDKPEDKSPEELSCEELAETSEPQLGLANSQASILMMSAFYNILENRLDKIKPEYYFDLQKMAIAGADR